MLVVVTQGARRTEFSRRKTIPPVRHVRLDGIERGATHRFLQNDRQCESMGGQFPEIPMTMKQRCCLLLLLSLAIAVKAGAQAINRQNIAATFGFENNTRAGVFPAGWGGAPADTSS